MLITLLRNSTNYRFFFWNIFRFESLQCPEKRRGGSSIKRKTATFNIFQTTAIHFPEKKKTNQNQKEINKPQHSPGTLLCLTFLPSETPGNIQLTQSTLLQVGITRLQQQPGQWPGWLLLTAVRSPLGKEGTGRCLLQELSSPERLSTPDSHTAATITQYSTAQLGNTVKTKQIQRWFFFFSRLLSINRHCEVAKFHSDADKNTYYMSQLSRGWKLEVYLQA